MKYSLIILFWMSSSFAAVQNISCKGGTVEFLAIGKPSFIKIHGKGNSASGKLSVEAEKIKGDFAFDLSSLDTDIEKRNEHMKTKYLEVSKFPKATLELSSVKPLVGWSIKNPKLDGASFEG